MNSDQLLMEYSTIIIDEAHERSLNVDFLLWLLKQIQKERKEKWLKELKIWVTSATIEKEKFIDYFDDAPSLDIPWRLYPVEMNYLEWDLYNMWEYYTETAKTVENISNTKEIWDILIFMPWKMEIDKTIIEIENYDYQMI